MVISQVETAKRKTIYVHEVDNLETCSNMGIYATLTLMVTVIRLQQESKNKMRSVAVHSDDVHFTGK